MSRPTEFWFEFRDWVIGLIAMTAICCLTAMYIIASRGTAHIGEACVQSGGSWDHRAETCAMPAR